MASDTDNERVNIQHSTHCHMHMSCATKIGSAYKPFCLQFVSQHFSKSCETKSGMERLSKNLQHKSGIARLRLTSWAIKQLQYPPLHSVLFIRLQGKEVVSSTAILETQALLCQLSL